MLAKRIIPCLDVKDGKVVKGVKFDNHEIVGDIIELASRYSNDGADELVFYDISASTKNEVVKTKWVELVAREINIPFCVAGGIKTLNIAERVLNLGADKISINTPALQDPELITNLANAFGSQCVVVGVDSFYDGNKYSVYAKTGDPKTKYKTTKDTVSWVKEAQEKGAGEIVLNCINQDGVRKGYDLEQLSLIRKQINIPLIASGGAGTLDHLYDGIVKGGASAVLAASIFHYGEYKIKDAKEYLNSKNVSVRL